uniref:Uncharacterized protein n=1 Tax=Bosea sp. NBC_00436 TaxID=2969620 RepID=A0A9E8CS99_9HYPH
MVTVTGIAPVVTVASMLNRGVEDVLIAVIDGPKGFPEAINDVLHRLRSCR